MLIRRKSTIAPSAITPERVFLERRRFLGGIGVAALALGIPGCDSRGGREERSSNGDVDPGEQHADLRRGPERWRRALQADDRLTPWEDVTGYNNFYEFGTGKSDPAENAKSFVTRPWTVRVEGLVATPASYQLEDFLKPHRLEDRIYRHRCVEAWSMVVPWRGFPLADLVRRVQPLASARFVEFTTLYDPQRMEGQRRDVLRWPYVEALRLDEAMHPLTLLVTGVYGKDLPAQNGAPLRLVVPWKYGFKGAKSIVRIRFTQEQPRTTWNIAAPSEYGFYANVNPEVDHPRWSQARERRIGEWRRHQTLMFNGYAEDVASLYAGLDLRRNY